ncbi:MAG: arginine--tRNA ligase [Pirellulales bacterium]|nr:arginine--tRNA ligase [Pirellulales bacterium]
MNILAELQRRFATALAGLADEVDELLAQVRPSQDVKFGDYQANCAMPLGKRLGKPPRAIAAEIIRRLEVADLCQPPEIAGPGFINLKLRDDFVSQYAAAAVADERMGVPVVDQPRTYVVDYSAPNVAKPMHVGHIRSTVIGDCLYRTLTFLGHRVIGDNHLGDWGTQFGMIIYGYKHFLDRAAFANSPIDELARIYRLVHTLVGYFNGRDRLAKLAQEIVQQEKSLNEQSSRVAIGDPKAEKKAEKELRHAERALHGARIELRELQKKLSAIDRDPAQSELVGKHPDIAQAVLRETAMLHGGDAENVALWKQFMPVCLEDIERIYRRLGVKFDVTLGESFYHDRLEAVVEDLVKQGLARESDGAMCVFLEGFETPFIVRKQDGAFLYATSDLATIRYRLERWRPDAILYVVDHRQSLHFEQLFATAKKWGCENVELAHVSFGTVLGQDGRPYKTRSGDTVGLWGLLDEGVNRAREIVNANDDAKPNGPELSADERQHIAEAVGIGALKYADLSQNRTSDYVFDYDKMLAMNGNTATYMQYAHARIRGIFLKGQIQLEGRGKSSGFGVQESCTKPPDHLPPDAGRQGSAIVLSHPAERALALAALQFPEALSAVLVDYRPNQLTAYLYELANRFSAFYENCPVLKAETPELLRSRLALCDLTAKVLRQGLSLLGIAVVERM